MDFRNDVEKKNEKKIFLKKIHISASKCRIETGSVPPVSLVPFPCSPEFFCKSGGVLGRNREFSDFVEFYFHVEITGFLVCF